MWSLLGCLRRLRYNYKFYFAHIMLNYNEYILSNLEALSRDLWHFIYSLVLLYALYLYRIIFIVTQKIPTIALLSTETTPWHYFQNCLTDISCSCLLNE